MSDPLRVLNSFATGDAGFDPHLRQEWLVTNGLGGYASGTVLGPITRRYHGLLIAALPNPLGRFMMLQSLSERMTMPGKGELAAGPGDAGIGATTLMPVEFRLEAGLPVWIYDIWGCIIEKRILFLYKQNTVHITWRFAGGPGVVRLSLRPGIHLRSHDAPVDTPIKEKYVLTTAENRFEISAEPDLPVLRMSTTPECGFNVDKKTVHLECPLEKRRGYSSEGSLWSPGYFHADLERGSQITLTASAEIWDVVEALSPEEASRAEIERRRTLLEKAFPQSSGGEVQTGIAPELVLAADQFLITPVGRREDAARARASGDEPQTVIAGYHWFTDWGRDTMISLEGLTLVTGRHEEARWILRTFAHYVKDGLIPNMFPEGEKEGLYHTADASLWFFHAVARYVEATGDEVTLRAILPRLREIADAHIEGTQFGIHVDPGDGLLSQGQSGYQLTWMDAKVDDWVVTPRRGKAVEINALWYNALRLLSGWMDQTNEPGAGRQYAHYAERARESFNRRFWNPRTGYLFDVVDGETGDDPLCRPNQLFAISLENPVLDERHWQAVVDVATRRLLTPVGLRSLAPDEPDYKPRYDGDLRSRDAAYHQGSVWAWLIGPYVDALRKVYPDRPGRQLLDGFGEHLDHACVGSISEIFDAIQPHIARGCIAQAWSVAEVLRCLVRLDLPASGR
jgi:predicted glycogen debranching enzyme